jgi:hypothetical protein
VTFPRPPAAPRSSTSASVCRLWRLLLLEDACPQMEDFQVGCRVAVWPFLPLNPHVTKRSPPLAHWQSPDMLSHSE